MNFATPVACVTNNKLTFSSFIMLFIFLIHLFLNSSSPTLKASSTIKISGSTTVATLKANLAIIPDEKFFTGTSKKF